MKEPVGNRLHPPLFRECASFFSQGEVRERSLGRPTRLWGHSPSTGRGILVMGRKEGPLAIKASLLTQGPLVMLWLKGQAQGEQRTFLGREAAQRLNQLPHSLLPLLASGPSSLSCGSFLTTEPGGGGGGLPGVIRDISQLWKTLEIKGFTSQRWDGVTEGAKVGSIWCLKFPPLTTAGSQALGGVIITY